MWFRKSRDSLSPSHAPLLVFYHSQVEWGGNCEPWWPPTSMLTQRLCSFWLLYTRYWCSSSGYSALWERQERKTFHSFSIFLIWSARVERNRMDKDSGISGKNVNTRFLGELHVCVCLEMFSGEQGSAGRRQTFSALNYFFELLPVNVLSLSHHLCTVHRWTDNKKHQKRWIRYH